MKILLLLLGIILALPTAAQKNRPKVKSSFYKNGYSNIYTIDDSGIYASRIFTFDSVTTEELKNRIATYFDERIARRISDDDANSSNISFSKNTYTISDATPFFKITMFFYAYARLTYKIEIKDNRVRATIFINSYYWGERFRYLSPQRFYPYKSGGGFEKCFKMVTEYIQSTLDNLPTDLLKENINLNNDW